MKVALMITGLGMGGAERQVCDLADRLARLGHNVLLISMTADKICYPADPNVVCVQLGIKKTYYDFIRGYILARRILKEFGADVVHSHMVHANIFSRLLRLTMPINRLICSAHSTLEGGWLRATLYRLTDRLADMTTNVSLAAVQSYIDKKICPSKKIKAQYNGIDTNKFQLISGQYTEKRNELGIPIDSKIVLAVGRLAVEKDYHNLLNAFSMISPRLANTQLVIIGEGLLKTELINLSIHLGVSGQVHFLGIKRDIPAWMSAADVFVLSSAWEGFGLVVAEAMACERVVIATDCGGVKEVLANHGILIPSHDCTKLATSIKYVLNLPEKERIEIGRAARQYVNENFSLKEITNDWLTLYQDICNEKTN